MFDLYEAYIEAFNELVDYFSPVVCDMLMFDTEDSNEIMVYLTKSYNERHL